MAMLTPILLEASRHLATVLVDEVQVYDVGAPVTVGATVTRPLTAVGAPVPGLVQTTVLANAVEGRSEAVFSVKVARGVALDAGQAVKVLSCAAEPSLVGQVLLVDKVSRNGLSTIRKAVASVTGTVNQEGKEALT